LIKWFRENKKKLYLPLSITYIVIVLISLVVCLVGYTFIENKFDTISTGYYKQIAGRYTDSLEAYFKSLRRMIDDVAESNYVEYYEENINVLEDNKYYMNFVKYLRNKIYEPEGVERIIVVLNGCDTVITESGRAELNDIYESLFSECGLDYESWKEKYINQFSYNQWDNEKIGSIGKRLVYSQSVPYKNIFPKDPTAKIIVIINPSIFERKMIEAGFDIKSKLMLYDIHKGALTDDSQSNKEISEEFYKSNSVKGMFYHSKNGEMLVRDSVDKGYFYWGVEVPSALVWKQRNIVRTVLAAVLMLHFVLILAVMVFMTRKHYMTLRSIASTLEKPDKVNSLQRQSLFENIETEINETMNKVREYEFANTHITHALKKQVLYNMLTENNGKHEQFNFDKVSFDKAYFCVILLGFYGENDKFDFSESSQIKLFHYGVCNIGEEIISDYCDVYSVSMTDSTIAFILNLDSGSADKKAINELTEQIIAALENLSNMEYLAEASDIITDIGLIGDSYKEVCALLEEHRANASEEVNTFRFPTDFEAVLFEKLKMGKAAEIMNYINEIIDNNFSIISKSGDEAYGIYAEFLQAYQKLCEMFGISGNIWETSDVNMTMDELRNKVMQYYADLCEVIDKNYSDKSEQILADAIEYIEKNFTDYSFDVNNLSIHLGYSRQYIGILFRAYKQTTTKDFIMRRRIDKAKELINSGENYTIVQIALKVGYSSAATFSRAFKRCEGVTVSQYKERLSHN